VVVFDKRQVFRKSSAQRGEITGGVADGAGHQHADEQVARFEIAISEPAYRRLVRMAFTGSNVFFEAV
jgi:hypothetical protein